MLKDTMQEVLAFIDTTYIFLRKNLCSSLFLVLQIGLGIAHEVSQKLMRFQHEMKFAKKTGVCH